MPQKVFLDTTGYLLCIVHCVFKSSLGQRSQQWPTFMCDCHNLTSQAHKLTHLCASQGRKEMNFEVKPKFYTQIVLFSV